MVLVRLPGNSVVDGGRLSWFNSSDAKPVGQAVCRFQFSGTLIELPKANRPLDLFVAPGSIFMSWRALPSCFGGPLGH